MIPCESFLTRMWQLTQTWSDTEFYSDTWQIDFDTRPCWSENVFWHVSYVGTRFWIRYVRPDCRVCDVTRQTGFSDPPCYAPDWIFGSSMSRVRPDFSDVMRQTGFSYVMRRTGFLDPPCQALKKNHMSDRIFGSSLLRVRPEFQILDVARQTGFASDRIFRP